MRISTRPQELDINGFHFTVARTTGGVIELWAAAEAALACALGFAHAHDRGVQLLLVRLIGQGRLSECLQADDETIAIDIFMREAGFARSAETEAATCDAPTARLATAYADGVNSYLARHGRPLELRLVGYRPQPWTLADTLLTVKLMSYINLAQSQQDLEKLLIQAIHGGVDIGKLELLLAPHLDGLDETLVGWIRQATIVQPLLPEGLRFLSALPRIMASNSWAVAGKRSASGAPLQCNDPHLECNRLPAIWYEAVLHTAGDDRIGVTMPGVPGLVMGRTRDLSFGFTYGFMDMIDYFLEDCRDGRCRRGDGFADLTVRTEQVLRRKGEPLTITIRETSHGVLEADARQEELADGIYLARAWSGQHQGAVGSLRAICELPAARTVAAAQQVLRHVSISCNWVLADRQGNIGFQQSGLLPARQHSGLYPVPGWDERSAWQGLVPADQLHSLLNPPEGFVVTANDDLNPPGGPLVINSPMGPYRADRLRELLAAGEQHTIADMQRFQGDLYSLQAERFMALLRPLLPDSLFGRLLKGWDCCYDRGSRAASLFEAIYQALLRRVLGEGCFGAEAWDELVGATSILADFYGFFDRALLDGDEQAWYGEQGRTQVLAEVVAEVMGALDGTMVEPWGRRRQVVMSNIFFDGRLPMWLGFDYGPIELAGCRATVVQGAVHMAHGRRTTFAPSWRYVTDLAEDHAETVLAGGPSGRRCSSLYRADIKRWLAGGYKRLGGPPRNRGNG